MRAPETDAHGAGFESAGGVPLEADARRDSAPWAGAGASFGPSRREIADRLRGVIDPEVGMNIVDLGLIYDLQVDDETALVRLTMTTPACPMSGYIRQEVGRALRKVPGLRKGITELVGDPPWSPLMMDPEARWRRFGYR